ncbi:hypothetical protein [Sinomonas humi]|uniref:hypothetical protein n=1 Tax=Sinomonas humi TaxID=1338436 RepID=UPI000690B2A3|nr:hypothetical protein [Sinomonas humi]
MSQDIATSPPLAQDRVPVQGLCPRCGSAALAAYPVFSEGGWFDVVKCQGCLHSVSRERGPLLGALRLLADQI